MAIQHWKEDQYILYIDSYRYIAHVTGVSARGAKTESHTDTLTCGAVELDDLWPSHSF